MERVDTIDQMKGHIDKIMQDVTGPMKNECVRETVYKVSMSGRARVSCVGVYIVKCDA